MDWLSKGFDVLFQLWERGGAILLWALTAISAVVFAVLVAGAVIGVAEAGLALESYGLLLVLAVVAFGILAAVKTIQSRYRSPTVHLIADETQSFWSQSKQQDGRITTQLSFRAQVTNLTDDVIKLSDVRISRPWTQARLLAKVLLTRHPHYPEVRLFSHENPIAPRAISEVHCTFMLERAIGRPGRPMIAVFKISDQLGRWHKVKLKLNDIKRPNAR
jgi:hypothetical protein